MNRLGCHDQCRGCKYRDIPYEEGIRLKEAWVHRALADHREVISPIRGVGEGRTLGYRRRVRLKALHDGSRWRFGMMRRDQLIPLEECPVQQDRVNRMLRVLMGLPKGIPLFMVSITMAQVALVFKDRHLPSVQFPLEELAHWGCQGLWGHTNPSAGVRIFAKNGWHLIFGKPFSFDETGTAYGPWSFAQQIPDLHRDSLMKALNFLSPSQGKGVADLYCGDGASLALWSSQGASTLGVEVSGMSLKMGGINSPSSSLLQGTCAQRVPQIADFLRLFPVESRLIYANPPRSGMEAEVLNMLGEVGVWRMAYLSCAASTLSRDLAKLCTMGYRVVKVIPYDFFPMTDHVECLALVERKG
ncbi:SAM-dependent methyltransferase, tRNA(uracil-5)-methyltransferase [Thermanaerovibrio velox DSM 12556]|uniref:SAM-dependent methyltransferase, tRNA(Uracil-5)-methyltransferase n=1 Tax=Thermanaerovibrio velox DSM 12556 TaxID=926567 RepID=H0UN69_9BACT|nr:class I SAM-dependent RNA methyltransferase [Thermanaerovibrio velox]EHM10354.1 SAM-dependent methyltransferase, tRNA(uracil-5)-methyltransferase [Thermanaerovibrio velox DSM 12556]